MYSAGKIYSIEKAEKKVPVEKQKLGLGNTTKKTCNGFLHTRKNKNNTMSYESNGGNKYKCRLLINNSCSRSFKCQLSRKKARSNGLRAIKDVCSKHFYRGQLNVVFE